MGHVHCLDPIHHSSILLPTGPVWEALARRLRPSRGMGLHARLCIFIDKVDEPGIHGHIVPIRPYHYVPPIFPK